MEMTYLSGRSFSSVTTGTKEENGDWNVKVLMTETLDYPNGTKREESIEKSAISPSFNVAHQTAMNGVLQVLQDLVYTRGFDSLIEARDYEKNLQVTDGDTIKFDAITPSE
jgi:hypothetical protein